MSILCLKKRDEPIHLVEWESKHSYFTKCELSYKKSQKSIFSFCLKDVVPGICKSCLISYNQVRSNTLNNYIREAYGKIIDHLENDFLIDKMEFSNKYIRIYENKLKPKYRFRKFDRSFKTKKFSLGDYK